jgi:hypothetical protein
MRMTDALFVVCGLLRPAAVCSNKLFSRMIAMHLQQIASTDLGAGIAWVEVT